MSDQRVDMRPPPALVSLARTLGGVERTLTLGRGQARGEGGRYGAGRPVCGGHAAAVRERAGAAVDDGGPPGGSYGPHEHRNDYVTVVAQGSHIASVMDDGHIEVEFEAMPTTSTGTIWTGRECTPWRTAARHRTRTSSWSSSSRSVGDARAPVGCPDAGAPVQLAAAGPATVHEAAGRTPPLDPALRPLQNGRAVCGLAFTVRCGERTTWPSIGQSPRRRRVPSWSSMRMGDARGYWGEILTEAAMARGIAAS